MVLLKLQKKKMRKYKSNKVDSMRDAYEKNSFFYG